MSAVVVVGAQWGDEGKGKVVDLYAPYAELVVRYAGGANAGHTLVVGGEKLILHLIPSGILHEQTKCVVGQGTVIDPAVFLKEIEALSERGVGTNGRLLVSQRAHVVLPHHKLIDELREKRSGGAIGTTKRGIGPCYEDKVARRGIRMGDLLDRSGLLSKLAANLECWRPVAEDLGGTLPTAEEVATRYAELGKALGAYIGDAAAIVRASVSANEKILLEGAQGTMLDIDNGTYPFVTSSNAVAGGACAGAGIGPTQIRSAIGIAKAYTTRVGGGPFPTELEDEIGQQLRDAGAEYGSTTGRPRRCGWLDLVALRHAVAVNGLSELAITKLDVLTVLPELKVCVAYELDGERLEYPPFERVEDVKPIYETLEGWDEELLACRSRADLPAAAQRYLDRIESEVGCRVGVVSVGPDRQDTADLTDPFG
ncbi:MAG: adenylosuccinate synthetase [Myxococcales bacterium SG8_38_1]|jgi:adenylosuccinate synthase|nr:MAG: adenylosuccinate synthetase [Myxococcales bacterium SG8_38_1]